MNDFELDKKLKAAETPSLEADYSENFPRSVLAGIRSASPRSQRTTDYGMPRWAWGGGIICACLLIGVLGDWRAQMAGKTPASDDPLANAKMIRETLAMFPHQVRAIVQDGRGLQLVISEKPDVPVSPPLYVRICRGKNCASFVTFSGQQVRIAGQTMTVLSDPQGSVIVIGDDFAWSSRKQISARGNFKIEARSLEAAAM